MAGTVSGGGMDRAWCRPLRHDGTVDSDDPELDGMVGTHQGEFVGYNIFNAQGGCEYVWERTKLQDRIRVRQRGGQIVQASDPERSGFSQILGSDDGLSGTPLDSSEVTNELMLVRYPEEAIRRKREQQQQKSEVMRRGGAEDFAERADARERQYSGARPGRFRRADHGIDMKDNDERLVDQWVPDDGILPVS